MSDQQRCRHAQITHALVYFLLLFVVAFTINCAAQQTAERLSNQEVRSAVGSSLGPLAHGGLDLGVVPGTFVAERMLLLLRRSQEQNTRLSKFLEEVHSPDSSHFHQWLTPQQFGELYGASDSDVSLVTNWLERSGFKIANISQGKTVIEFSGTAAQVREAFHMEIHQYERAGIKYHATNQEAQIPDSLAPMVAGLTPISDFPIKPSLITRNTASSNVQTQNVKPDWTRNTGDYLLTPGDFSVQYDIGPVYNAGNNGAGVTVGVVGLADVNPAYVTAYQALFNLPANPVQVVLAGSDPGTLNDYIEPILDVEVLNGVAPGATINMYVAQGTAAQQALNLSALKAVEDNVAAVLTVSYGFCEQTLGKGGNTFWNAIWQQAAAQGQTVLVSSDDFGSAGCDNLNYQPVPQAIYGLAVNGIASTPWNIAVGGTDFSYNNYAGSFSSLEAELATYWNQTTTSLPSVSLLKPIPEQPWNTAFGANLYNRGVYSGGVNSGQAGAGGVSSCTAGGVNAAMLDTCTGAYAKPAWQQGPGVPADGVRDLPDVSLFAGSENSNDSAYVICATPTDCIVSKGSVAFTPTGATSASTPAMAGIMALVVQRYGRQGQANYVLYPLAVQHPSVFHDITTGTNDVPCVQGSPNCTLSTKNDNRAGVYTLGQYPATPGYDLATGLGSVDVALLLQYWNSVSTKPAAALMGAVSSMVLNSLQSSVVSATVSAFAALPSPTGSVSVGVLRAGAPDYSCDLIPLASGTVACTLQGTFLGQGQDSVIVSYSGDITYAPSQILLPVTVTAPFFINGTPVSFTAGATTGNSSTITVSGLQGFAGTVGLNCSLMVSPGGAQNLPTCSLPQSVTVTGANPTLTSMAILSQGALSASSRATSSPQKPWEASPCILTFAGLGLLLAGPASRRRHFWTRLALVATFLVSLSGCGKGDFFGTREATTPGVYQFVVNANAQGIIVGTTINVTVQ